MGNRLRRTYSFGDWSLEPSRHRLRKGDRPVPLRPKTFRVLQYLLDHRNRVVGKTELLDAVWSSALVDESVVSQCIRELRKALNDDLHAPQYIQTVPKVGYMFIAAVQEVARERKEGPSVAVLAFTDMSSLQDQAFLCEGIAEQIISGLAQVGSLRVAARTSSFSFKSKPVDVREIGRCLNVETVLEGSLRRVENRIRIAVQLIKVADGYHLWSAAYDRELIDLFDLQDEIALEIVRHLQTELAGRHRTTTLKRQTTTEDAYFAYLRGRHHLQTLRDFEKAIECYREAVALDPDYAAPYAGLAGIYGNQIVWAGQPLGVLLPPMREAALKALDLDPSLAETHFALCFLRAHERDYREAEAEGRLAVSLNPNLPEAYAGLALCALSVRGRHQEAIASLEQALQADPLSPFTNFWMGMAQYVARNNTEAVRYLDMALDLDPDFTWAHWYLGLTYLEEELHSEAVRHFDVVGAKEHPYVLARIGRVGEARAILETWQGDRVAQTRTALRDLDQAFALLERTYSDPMIAFSPENTMIKVDPVWDPLRDDPRFAELLRITKLDDE